MCFDTTSDYGEQTAFVTDIFTGSNYNLADQSWHLKKDPVYFVQITLPSKFFYVKIINFGTTM